MNVAHWLDAAGRHAARHMPGRQPIPAYGHLSSLADTPGVEAVCAADAEAIDADVERSAIKDVDSHMSTAQHAAHCAALRRVLRAWCVMRPDIGYAQSMNFIAGLCLALVAENEAQAFTLFCGLLATLDPQFHAQWPPLAGFQVLSRSWSSVLSQDKLNHNSIMAYDV